MTLVIDRSRVENLRAFVDERVRQHGCDHTHRFTQEWAAREALDWDALLDILEANGGFCDCEVVLNLPEDFRLQSPAASAPADNGNPWLIPAAFTGSESQRFCKVILCQAGLGRNTHARDAELLVPAPKGARPLRRVRKSVHFFIGWHSGLPCEVGVVQECSDISASEFARRVATSGIKDLCEFSFREAAFVLSRIASLKPSTPVATNFVERIGIASRHEELTVHRVILRR